MKVTGEPDKIREFIEVIQRDDYNAGRHFYRIFNADIDDENTIEEGFVIINGDCAWSVHTCMMEGQGAYSQEEFIEYHKKLQEVEKKINNKTDLALKNNYLCEKQHLEESLKASSLIRESKLLNLTIEVFSEEYGVGFQEHYVIQNGNVIIDECVDAQEYVACEFDTVEEFNEEYGLNITKEQFEEDDYIVIGGFGDWEFDEY